MKVALITGITGQDGAYLAEFLLKKGYEVQCLRNAAGIVDGMPDWPDLFILDKDMALIDGIAICKFLKLHQQARSIPILMISGSDCKAKAKAAGVDHYIEKPLNLNEFLRVVETYVQTSPATL